MAITRYNPRTIHLGGEVTIVNDVAASEGITPGYLIERISVAGTPKFRKHATAGGAGPVIIALDQPHLNVDYDHAYALGDQVVAAVAQAGSTFYGVVPSGQNLAAGARVESAGNGKFRALASGVALGVVLEDIDNSAGPGDARFKYEAL